AVPRAAPSAAPSGARGVPAPRRVADRRARASRRTSAPRRARSRLLGAGAERGAGAGSYLHGDAGRGSPRRVAGTGRRERRSRALGRRPAGGVVDGGMGGPAMAPADARWGRRHHGPEPVSDPRPV